MSHDERNGGDRRAEGLERAEDLLPRLEPLVRSVVAGFTWDPATADELAQACRIRIYEKRRRCRDPEAVFGWAKRLCERVCLTAAAEERRDRDRFAEDEDGVAGAAAPIPDPGGMVAGVQNNLDRCHDALDRVTHDLTPVELDGHPLEFALSILCRRAEEDGFVVERDIRRSGDVLDAEGRLAVFRIVQEALNNARRHSGAGGATVRCWREGRRLCAEVRDSGAGFPSDDVEPHLSLGLGVMRARRRPCRRPRRDPAAHRAHQALRGGRGGRHGRGRRGAGRRKTPVFTIHSIARSSAD